MSKISRAVAVMQENNKLKLDETVKNFMGGESYKLNPLQTLKIIAASSIFGEASYYRKDVKDGKFSWERDYVDPCMKDIFSANAGKSTTEVFTDAIDNALAFDFEGTLALAVELRSDYNMRLNPQVIMVRASIHKDRAAWTEKNPGKFSEYEKKVMFRADDPMSQLAYYLFINHGKKNKLPTILKKACAAKLSELKPYQVNKYKNHEIGMINAVRLTHANSEVLNELMKTGKIEISEDQETWERLRSAGESWTSILNKTDLGHMALLRNLRNIFTEVTDDKLTSAVLSELKKGVPTGKQFPYRYYNAYRMIEASDINHKSLVLDTLEECIDIAIANMPKLKGKTMALSDNSGSAWGAFTSEYGRNTIAEIDNLSAVIAAMSSDEGYVGKFGDTLLEFPILKRNGALSQAKKITKNRCDDVGGSTEGGIWEFFKKAIENKEHWDNIFIYSDCQAGTGGLYGTPRQRAEYSGKYLAGTNHINVFKLIQEYRKKVNPTCNVFSVQTAGYDNVLVPQMGYRTAFMTGWTGKEAEFANKYIETWDDLDSKQRQKKAEI